jgi:hypothetical protein
MSKITGMISGWDRLRFRGTVRMLAHVAGLWKFLSFTGRSYLKDFGAHAEALSRQVRAASLAAAEQTGRPVVHLASPGVCKEEVAREIQARDRVKEGLICVLTAVEPCWSFNIKSNRERGKLELVRAYRKCQHLYHYYQHPVWGFMHARLQTWLPFNLWVCVNGREWLSRQMDAAGIKYLRRGNCFPWISDVEQAQALLNQQVSFNWQSGLQALMREVNPAFQEISRGCGMGYYWSLEESEWASDIMFREQAELTGLYGRLIRHGIESLGSSEVLRFLGHKVRADGQPHGNFALDVMSDLVERPEGIRIKHRLGANSLKMYNKQGTVLRVETTLNNMRELKSPRKKGGKVVWQRMRKGVADIARRAQVSEAANQRYLSAMAAVENPVPLKTLTEALARPVVQEGRRARGLNLLGAADARLLELVGDGKFLLSGFRNKDLQAMLLDAPAESPVPVQLRQRSGQITRKLWLLRAHGLIRKVAGTHRYLVTNKGRQVITALQAARNADVIKLAKAA